MRFQLDVEEEARGPIARLSGRVTLEASAEIRRRLLDVAEAAAAPLRICLGGVTRMDSSGVAVLAEVVERTRRVGRPVSLVNPSPAVRSVLALNRLQDVLPIEQAADEAGP